MSISTASPAGIFTTASVRSKDGTSIGYRQVGDGPGVIVLHGAMESAQSHEQLANALGGTFTVYLPDRRGRGLSGPYGENDGIKQPAAQVPTALLRRFDLEIAQGKVASALITGMKAAQMGPPIFNLIPRWPLEQLTKMAMASNDKKAAPGHVSMSALAPTLHHDFQLIVETEGAIPTYSATKAEVLLLGGEKSPAYLRAAVDALHKALPNARRVEFPGLGHGATGNGDRGGKPALVAQVLREFFCD
jgi:pimeloyl-ACP methyl ester carboxylesterase